MSYSFFLWLKFKDLGNKDTCWNMKHAIKWRWLLLSFYVNSSYFIGVYLRPAKFESEEVSGWSKTLLGKMCQLEVSWILANTQTALFSFQQPTRKVMLPISKKHLLRKPFLWSCLQICSRTLFFLINYLCYITYVIFLQVILTNLNM